jgi:phosphatidylglycerophosphatase A
MPATRVGWLDRIAIVIGSLAMSGFFPLAPATFASALSAAALWWLYPLNSWTAYAAVVVALFAVGVWACGRMEFLYGHDPSAAVIDEVCGMAIALAGAPMHAATVLPGFLLFRVFDVLKLAPGRRVERLPGGWGVMMDDVVAGVYAFVALRALLWIWPEPRLRLWHGIALAVAAGVLFAFRKPLQRRFGKPRTRIHAIGERRT